MFEAEEYARRGGEEECGLRALGIRTAQRCQKMTYRHDPRVLNRRLERKSWAFVGTEGFRICCSLSSLSARPPHLRPPSPCPFRSWLLLGQSFWGPARPRRK